MGRELSENARLAAAIIESAIEAGVGEWVVGAGARNLPLIETLLRVAEDQRGRVWNFFEERSAAFFALGRARCSSHRVAVITTSGTAAAELLPATIEAHYSAVPLLLITADRPREFRGSGAPQAIEQEALLTPYVWRSLDLVAPTERGQIIEHGQHDRPEHWNVCLAEPGDGDGAGEVRVDVATEKRETDETGTGERISADQLDRVRSFCCEDHADGPLAVLLGELSAAERAVVETPLAKLGAPVWAEATSGLRESALLRPLMPPRGERGIAALKPKRVLRIGGVPSLRFWRELETMPDVAVMSLTRSGSSGLARDSIVIESMAAIRGAGQVGAAMNFSTDREPLDELLRKYPGSEPALVRRLSERIDEDALVYLGNSLPIREWNLAATIAVPHPNCRASRGANGIDGQVSTFLGLVAQSDISAAGGWGIFGDLTALYDLSAPWIVPQLDSGAKRRIVVINNGGGRIFDRLPALARGSEQQRRLVRNQHQHDFRHWAAMWNLGYAAWLPGENWREPDGDAAVIEIKPSPNETEAFWDAWEKASSVES